MSDPILFEAFDTGAGSGEGSASLKPLESFGFNGAVAFGRARLFKLTSYGTGVITRSGAGIARIALRSYGNNRSELGYARLPPLASFGSEVGIKPNVALGIVTLPFLTSTGTGIVTRFGAGISYLGTLRTRGLQHANFGVGQLAQIGARGEEVIHNDRYIAIIQSPGYFTATMGPPNFHEHLTERIGFRPIADGDPIQVIIEQLGLAGRPLTMLDALTVITDSMGFADKCAVLYKMIVNEAIGLTGEATPSLFAINAVHEALALALGAGHSVAAFNSITHALAFADALYVAARENITEELGFQNVFAQSLVMRQQLLEELGIGDGTSMHASMGAILEETIGFGDSATTFAEVFETLRDSIEFQVQLQIGDTAYLGWVVNTASKAFVSYENFPFNSFATWEATRPKQYYGMMPDGIYLLSGDKDAEEDINTRIRVGLSNLGTGREKRFPAMYLGLAADGPMLLKVITTDSTNGTRVENWYKLTPRAAGDMRESRVKIGRKLKAVYWDFVIENVDGSNLDLDNVQLQPLVLDRRTRGRDGN
ncbi:MAG TPA: hypothetical protein VLE97_01820 [Gaiellaceae bacterium]|nr:hypothetical protein [Gaiellaceae bacterium]